jgi:vitamin B12 transporter
MKNCTNRARFATLSLALGVALSAQAQTPLQLPTQLLTATRVATPVTDIIADVSIIDRDALELAGQSSLRDMLSMQPGVQIATSGGYRSTTGVFLRGSVTSQTLVLVDGLRVGSATSGGRISRCHALSASKYCVVLPPHCTDRMPWVA